MNSFLEAGKRSAQTLVQFLKRVGLDRGGDIMYKGLILMVVYFLTLVILF